MSRTARFFPVRPAARLARVAALCAGLLLVVAGSALAGPPWISVEIPANPNIHEARGAMLLVRAYHHDLVRAYPVTGVAEGIVDGERRSVPLEILPTGTAGLYAVAEPDLDEGRWVLVLTLEGGDIDATALVSLDARAEIAGVRVPTNGTVDGFTIPRAASDTEIEALLREGDVAGAGHDASTGKPLVAALGLLALVIGIPIVRARGSR